MSEYKRLTTENPQGNMENMLNITKVINHEVYIRNWNGEADLNLVDYCKEQYKSIYGRSIDADLEEKITAEEFGEFMDGDDLLSLFYWMAVGHAELRVRLSEYEDSSLSPEDIKKEYTNNEPLSIDDLKQMDGLPVWTNKRCGVVRARPDKIPDIPAIHFNYGWEWATDVLACGPVYRHKPKLST